MEFIMKKWSVLILSLMVMILAISAVGAADTNLTSDLAQSQVDDDSVDLATDDSDVVQTSENTESLAAEGDIKGTYTDLQNQINNATEHGVELTLPYNFTYTKSVDGDNFREGIVIDDILTINGNGYTISGDNSQKIFKVNATKGIVTFNNITFTDSLGAVKTTAELSINDCTFINNNYNYGVYNWGAIYSYGNLTITNSKFVNNAAMYGGAIYIEDCDAIIRCSEFINNTAAGDGESGGEGGAIKTLRASTLNFDNCVFSYNTAIPGDPRTELWMSWGAAIDADSDMVITNSEFNNNNASCGAAIGTDWGNVMISNSNFTDNSAIFGAAIENLNSELTIGGSNFTGNKADVGGAICNDAEGILSIISCIFTRNEANQGCAIYNELMGEEIGELTIEDSTFTNNGGADNYSIYNEGTLSLAGNNVDNLIYNNGTINSTTNVTVLGAKTVETEYGATVTLNATYTDDNGNLIKDSNFKFIVHSVKGLINANYANGLYTAEYKVNVVGQRVVSVDLGYEVTVYTGLLDIKTPNKLATHFNITNGVITIYGYAVDTKAGERGMAYSTVLLDENGNPVDSVPIKFVVKDKIYDRTTYENGSFNPYNLNMASAGKYTMAFFFGGNDYYNSTFAAVYVVLAKKELKIKASAKSFKASAKTKKYTVKLSTIVGSSADRKAHLGAGMKVVMKINGKTYISKTNSKGQVTFNLKITKKGTFTAKISYKGDNTYKAATKTVKIKIK